MRETVAEGRIIQEDADAINRGETRLFHYASSWKDDRGDLLFRLLPLLSRSRTEGLRPEQLPAIPSAVPNLIAFAADVVELRRDELWRSRAVLGPRGDIEKACGGCFTRDRASGENGKGIGWH